MDMKEVEGFYYYQDEKHATVLIVDYLKHYVQKIMNCPPRECTNDETMQYISVDTATIMLEGFSRKFFVIQEINYGNSEPSEEQKRKFRVFEEFNKRYIKHSKYIEEETRLYKVLNEKRLAYTDINDRHIESLQKVDPTLIHDFVSKFIPEDLPEKERTIALVEIMKNRDKNGFDDLMKEMHKDKAYEESNELSKKIQPAFMEFLKAFVDVELLMAKEYSLYTDEYKNKMDEYADKGLFLYCLNTPDLPIDAEDITMDDIYNYFLNDDAMFLQGMFETFVKFGDVGGEINKREADDIVASYNLLIEGKYWASLRNLYALIDHHHKLCADIFNGYEEAKKEFKNGKQRSEYIGKLFTDTKVYYYETVWHKIDAAIEEMNKGGGDRFVSRNAIIHGDYEKPDVNPQAKDVVNVFMIYISMRMIIDRLANIEEIIKESNIYYLSYKTKGWL